MLAMLALQCIAMHCNALQCKGTLTPAPLDAGVSLLVLELVGCLLIFLFSIAFLVLLRVAKIYVDHE